MSSVSPIAARIDLSAIRDNLRCIKASANVPLYAVVKANAYGLGAARIAGAIADLVDGFCVFSLREAVDADLRNTTAKPAIALGPPETLDPQPWLDAHVRPAVATPDQAAALRDAGPILNVDTGMQRFSCPPEQIDQTLRAGHVTEAFTHAVNIAQVRRLVQLTAGRALRLHAAASALLDQPESHLNAVRPGLAMYTGAVRISTPLVEAHQSRGAVGYTAFHSAHHGVILAGYSHGLRPGPCLINGRVQQIIETGMQTAYVSIDPTDKPGDPVLLLDPALTEHQIAPAWQATAHEVLIRLSQFADRTYID